MRTTVETGSRQRAGYEAEDSSAGGYQAATASRDDNKVTVYQEVLTSRQLAYTGLVIYNHAADISDSPTLRAARLALSSRRAGIEPVNIGHALVSDPKLTAQGAHRPRRTVNSGTRPEGAYWTRAAKEEARILREKRFRGVVEAEFGHAQRMQDISIDLLADFVDRHRPRTIDRRDIEHSEQDLKREVAVMISNANAASGKDEAGKDQAPNKKSDANITISSVVFTSRFSVKDLVSS